MKRMVKNGDLIDVEPDGTITVAGKPIGGGGGGGSDYTAGSNIEISEAKEISLKRDLTDVHTVNFSDNTSCEVAGYSSGSLYIRSKTNSFSHPQIILQPNTDSYYKNIYLNFTGSPNISCHVRFDASDSNGKTSYAFLTRDSKVPLVPSSDGTYVLKATVSGGAVTYTWVAQ